MNASEKTVTIGFVNGRELKKGDIIEYEIKRLAGVDYTPPIIHRGTVVTPVYNKKPFWVVQIYPKRFNDRLPNYDFYGYLTAIYGDSIVKVVSGGQK